MSAPSLCLIHGWAANRHIFSDFVTRLPPAWHITAVDLPGHGDAPFDGIFDVADAADHIASTLTQPSYLLGWSLGGLVALYLAHRHPDKVRALCLTASFAKFQAAPDYPEGLSNPALAKMITLFEQDYHKYMRQFLQLQFLYAKAQHPVMEKVLPDIVRHGAPAALQTALDAVAAADARALLPEIRVPVLLLFGGKDSITPPRMGEYLHRNLPDSGLHVIGQAAHAPFLSHADECARLLADFIGRQEACGTVSDGL